MSVFGVRWRRIAAVVVAVVSGSLLLAGPTPAAASVVVGSPVVGRGGNYDYSPSVIQSGSVQKFWWCGSATNPQNPSQFSDAILYESIDLVTHAVDGPRTVLAETPGTWDSLYTCNAAVVQGVFRNPLGDGVTYGYAMYYVGTNTPPGVNNQIGVAFSTDGIGWRKYPAPIVVPNFSGSYGVGEPAPYNADGGSGIWLFYENDGAHVLATSTDGVHFGTAGTLTTAGLRPGDVTWGDIAYDSAAGLWYAVFDNPVRDPASTGGVVERGQYGSTLYRISTAGLFSGRWQDLTTVDTNLTGYEANFIPGLLRDPYGNVNVGPYPQIELYASTSVPRPSATASPAQAGSSGDISRWEILWSVWAPGQPARPLVRYYSNGLGVHEVSTGWVDTTTFHVESTLGYLFEAPTGAATTPLYGCKAGSTDYFVSPSQNCEGQRLLGLQGYAFPTRSADNQTPLYRCYTGRSHFISPSANCEGQVVEQLLGYAQSA